ncbi:MAG: DUF4177 domain-containing protein [Tissierellia bacterium]|jgi:hypothetical protein|nr:DUF4177 domain-containing protein [Tissierellia bacterium]MDD3752166.1 DUF4177 domain-containing protein [Tissierellia bacterium]
MKYQYEYVNVKNAKFFSANSTEHREIIDEYARRGYRFICFIPTTIEGYGRITSFDLVFEKPEE